jgi:acid stress chaperone HdeB
MQVLKGWSGQITTDTRNLLVKIWFAFLPLTFVLLLFQSAEAQMTIDIAKKSLCRQYLFDKTISPEAPRVAAWLSGYFNGRQNNTTIDIGAMRANQDKVEDYCRLNLDTTLIDAAKKSLGIYR